MLIIDSPIIQPSLQLMLLIIVINNVDNWFNYHSTEFTIPCLQLMLLMIAISNVDNRLQFYVVGDSVQ